MRKRGEMVRPHKRSGADYTHYLTPMRIAETRNEVRVRRNTAVPKVWADPPQFPVAEYCFELLYGCACAIYSRGKGRYGKKGASMAWRVHTEQPTYCRCPTALNLRFI